MFFFLFFLSSLANFSNPFTFKHINDVDIADVEGLIRTKTIHMLEKNLNESVLGKHNDRETDILIEDSTLKEYFGDVYYNDPHNFEFLPGDIKLIKLLVAHVQKNVDSKGENKGLRNYKPKPSKKAKKHIESNKENVEMAVDNADNDINDSDSDIDSKQLVQLKSALFNKIMEYMRIYNVNEIIDLKSVTDGIVSVSSHKKKISGHVYCVICQNKPGEKKPQPKRVSYNDGCWIPSNFTTHLKIAHKLVPQSTKRKADMVKTENKVEQIKCPKIESSNDAAEQIWLNQISQQITTMTRAVHQNFEQQSEMQFYIDEHDESSLSSVKTTNSPGDGNCMLQSSGHQVFHHKMKSTKLKTAYKQMRANVVHHIKENYASFEQLIKGHVYEIQEERNDPNFDVERECLLFLNSMLPQNRCWTGTETLKALSIIYKVNIIILYEEGPVNVVTNDAKKLYDKTIILAYRISQSGLEVKRNHYDSVTDIESDVIYSLAQQISKKMSKM